MSNPDELRYIVNNTREIAEAIALGVTRFLQQ